MSKPDNPQAFPGSLNQSRGITARDYFAAKAMQGILATYSADTPLPTLKDVAPDTAVLAYAIADAMLLEREKQDQ